MKDTNINVATVEAVPNFPKISVFPFVGLVCFLLFTVFFKVEPKF
jgi:hypothetical protein